MDNQDRNDDGSRELELLHQMKENMSFWIEVLEDIIKNRQSENGSDPKNRSTGSGRKMNWRDVHDDHRPEKASPVKGSRYYQESYYQGHDSERRAPGTSGISRREEQYVPKEDLDDRRERDMRHTDRSSNSMPEDAQRRFSFNNRRTDRQQSENGSDPKNRSTGSGRKMNWRDVLNDHRQEKVSPVKGSRYYQESYYQGPDSERSGPGTSGISRREEQSVPKEYFDHRRERDTRHTDRSSNSMPEDAQRRFSSNNRTDTGKYREPRPGTSGIRRREEQSVPKEYFDDRRERDMRHTDRSSNSIPEDYQRRFSSNNRTDASKNYLEDRQDKDMRLPRGRYYDYDESSGSGSAKNSGSFRSDQRSIPEDNRSGKLSTSNEREGCSKREAINFVRPVGQIGVSRKFDSNGSQCSGVTGTAKSWRQQDRQSSRAPEREAFGNRESSGRENFSSNNRTETRPKSEHALGRVESTNQGTTARPDQPPVQLTEHRETSPDGSSRRSETSREVSPGNASENRRSRNPQCFYLRDPKLLMEDKSSQSYSYPRGLSPKRGVNGKSTEPGSSSLNSGTEATLNQQLRRKPERVGFDSYEEEANRTNSEWALYRPDLFYESVCSSCCDSESENSEGSSYGSFESSSPMQYFPRTPQKMSPELEPTERTPVRVELSHRGTTSRPNQQPVQLPERRRALPDGSSQEVSSSNAYDTKSSGSSEPSSSTKSSPRTTQRMSPKREASKPMTFATSWEEDQYIRGLPTDEFIL